MSSRLVFLNLFKIKLPLPAIISISHRLTGLYVSVSLIWMLYTLYFLKFCNTASWRWLTTHPLWLIIAYTTVITFMYHLIAGVRHVIDDFTHDHELSGAVRTAKIALAAWLLLSLLFIMFTLDWS